MSQSFLLIKPKRYENEYYCNYFLFKKISIVTISFENHLIQKISRKINLLIKISFQIE